MNPKGKISDAELNAYLDAELSPEVRRAVENWLADDPENAAKAAELRGVDEAIRARYGAVADEPLPENIRTVLSGRIAVAGSRRWLQLAAAVLLLLAGGVGGFVLRGVLPGPMSGPTAWLAGALNAHTVYVSEVRHPVEVAASEEQHLVKWLTKRIGAEIRAPNLTARGFQLLGGRLLPHDGNLAAQFMYQDAGGKRLTLYVRQAGGAENSAFQFASHGSLSAFYWIDQPLAYALIGVLSRENLLAIARITYEELN